MITQTFSIDQTQKNFNFGFTVKQIKVENNTPFYLYINTDGSLPTRVKSNFVVQPNSTFISPEITTNVLNVVSSEINLSKGISQLTVYDNKNQDASNIPIQTAQFIGSFPNYPFQIGQPVPGVTSFDLPAINVEKFQTIFFMVSPTSAFTVTSSNMGYVIYNKTVTNDIEPIGAVSAAGGLISYIPTKIPTTINPVIKKNEAINDVMIDVIQSGEDLNFQFMPAHQESLLSDKKFHVNPPYFIYEVYGYDKSIATPISGEMALIYWSFDVSTQIVSKQFSTSVPAANVEVLVVKPTLRLITRPGIVVFDFNGVPSSTTRFIPFVYSG